VYDICSSINKFHCCKNNYVTEANGRVAAVEGCQCVNYNFQFHLLTISVPNLRAFCILIGRARSVDTKVYLTTVTGKEHEQHFRILPTSNAEPERFKPLLRVTEVTASNLGSDAFRDLPQLLQENAGIVS
jgi:hypothetical protein